MASFFVRIGIKDGHAAEFEKIVDEIWHDTHKLEPGCRRYEYWRGQAPGSYICLLSFDSYPDFIVHQTSDHHEKDAPRIVELIETFDVEWVDPMHLANGLVPTAEKDVAADADDLTKRYAADFPISIAAWWDLMRGVPKQPAA